jgi:hypothetical protein
MVDMTTMRAVLVVLCAVAGCSSPGKQAPAPLRDAGRADAVEVQAVAPWELRYATYRAGEMFGSILDVTIKSDGNITVHTDLALTGQVTVTPEELAPLAQLLDGDAFRSVHPGYAGSAAGTVTALVLKGEHSLDARWSDVPREAVPVIEEVLRLIPLAGSRPVFSVWITTRTPAGSEDITISSAGRVELSLGPTVLGRYVLPSEALDGLRARLAAVGAEGLEVPFDAGAKITITVSGEYRVRVNALSVRELPELARGLYEEARRIAAAVPASPAR